MPKVLILTGKKSYKTYRDYYLPNTPHMVLRNRPTISSHGKAYLSKQLPWRAAGDPRLAQGRSWFWALSPGPRGCPAHAFFSTLPSFLLGETVFLHLPNHPRESVRVNCSLDHASKQTEILSSIQFWFGTRNIANNTLYPGCFDCTNGTKIKYVNKSVFVLPITFDYLFAFHCTTSSITNNSMIKSSQWHPSITKDY